MCGITVLRCSVLFLEAHTVELGEVQTLFGTSMNFHHSSFMNDDYQQLNIALRVCVFFLMDHHGLQSI